MRNFCRFALTSDEDSKHLVSPTIYRIRLDGLTAFGEVIGIKRGDG